MGHTNSTANLGLPQFIGTDKPTWLSDVNGAFSAIDTYAGNNDAALAITDGKADTAIADASNAVTTAGNAATTAGNAAATATNANTVAGNALTIVNNTAAKMGDLTQLVTTDKSSLVAAVNEVAGSVSTPSAAQVTYDNTVSGLTATDVQAAIDELASSPAVGKTVLWSNPDPAQVFAGQPVTLSDSILNYDLIKIQVIERNDRAGMYEAFGVVSLITTGTSFVDVGFVAGSTMQGEHGRRANFTDNTTITFDTGYSGGTAGTNYAIPYKVIGIKY